MTNAGVRVRTSDLMPDVTRGPSIALPPVSRTVMTRCPAPVPAETRFVWLWGPTNIARQHHPTLLQNGHILLFDNGQSASQIIELDPLTSEVVWRYAPLDGFYSEMRGSVQRLPNGNTLVTESDPGVVFEVTPGGETVWRYLNPLTTADGLREPIWRMTRFDPQDVHFLDQ